MRIKISIDFPDMRWEAQRDEETGEFLLLNKHMSIDCAGIDAVDAVAQAEKATDDIIRDMFEEGDILSFLKTHDTEITTYQTRGLLKVLLEMQKMEHEANE